MNSALATDRRSTDRPTDRTQRDLFSGVSLTLITRLTHSLPTADFSVLSGLLETGYGVKGLRKGR